MLIEAAEASVRRGNNKKALQYFKRAMEDLKDYENCQSCK